jgi:hypothetical protein
MHITTDLSTDTAPASRHQRAEAGAAASSSPASRSNPSAASAIDPSLQRLTDVPLGALDAQWEIQDPSGAVQAAQMARQSMERQPDTVLAAQANPLPQNVLNLLQPVE